MLKPIDHCLLCDLKELVPGKGPVCSLTQEKPAFISRCSTIELDENLRERLTDALEYSETVKHSKGMTMLNFYTYLGLSVVVAGGAYALHNFLWDIGWISTLPFVVGVAGVSLLGLAIGPLRKYKTHMELGQAKLDKIANVLKVYGKSYNYETEIVKRRHEEPEQQAKCIRLAIK